MSGVTSANPGDDWVSGVMSLLPCGGGSPDDGLRTSPPWLIACSVSVVLEASSMNNQCTWNNVDIHYLLAGGRSLTVITLQWGVQIH